MSAPDLGLDGQVAVVTGAAGQLGGIWSAALRDAGATVAGIDLRPDGGSDARIEAGDVTDRESMRRVARVIESEVGPVGILVNNAGIDQPPDAAARTQAIENIPLEDFRATVDVNLVGAFNVTQAFGSRMRDRGEGSIVNIGSLYATRAPDPVLYDHMQLDPPFLKPPAYAASKAGVLALTRYFARLWGPAGVRVNAISPGGVAGGQDEEFVRKYNDRVPMRRMAEPEDLTGTLVYLASPASRYVTGQEIRVDGGFTT